MIFCFINCQTRDYSDKYNTNKKFDYKDYDIGEDNRTLRERINYIKESYKVSS